MKRFFENTKSLFLIIFIIAVIPPSLSLLIKNPPPAPGSDATTYTQIAMGLLKQKTFYCPVVLGDIKLPNACHPLYPFFIAIIYFFTGSSFTAVKIAQILMQGLTSVTIFLIAERIFRDRIISFIAGIIWAVYIPAIYYSVTLLQETFFTFLLAVSILFILKTREDHSLRSGLLAGLFLGFTALTKSVILPFIPILFLWMALSSKDRLILKLKNYAIIVLFIALTIFPWLNRNYIVLKQFLPVATGGGLSFYIYNNEETLGVINSPKHVVVPLTEEEKRTISNLSEPEVDRYLYDLGWKFAKSHTKDFFKIRLTQVCHFWHLWPASPKKFVEYYAQEYDVNKHPLLDRFKDTNLLYFFKILYHMPYNILFLGMFVSLFVSFKKDREGWENSILLFLLIGTINIVYVFHHGTDRYRVPLDPYVFILGLHGVISILKIRYGKRSA